MTERKAAQRPEENDTNQPQTQLLLQRGEDGQLIIHAHLPPFHINGDQFANRLYERREQQVDEVNDGPKSPAARSASSEMRKRLLQLSARLGQDEPKARAWVEQRYEVALDELGPEQLGDAVRYLADRLNQRNGAKPVRRDGKPTAA